MPTKWDVQRNLPYSASVFSRLKHTVCLGQHGCLRHSVLVLIAVTRPSYMAKKTPSLPRYLATGDQAPPMFPTLPSRRNHLRCPSLSRQQRRPFVYCLAIQSLPPPSTEQINTHCHFSASQSWAPGLSCGRGAPSFSETPYHS